MSTRSVDETAPYRWKLFWWGLPEFPFEHAVTIDQFNVWRQHLVWSKSDGQRVRTLMTQRFSTNSVLLSLMVSAQLVILFSRATPAADIRSALEASDFTNFDFWTGLVLVCSIVLSVIALYTNFTAWSVLSVISDNNAHAFLRSSLGLYATQAPSRLVVAAIYAFFLTIALALFVIIHWGWATGITTTAVILLVHLNSTYSALGRIIMETGAMGDDRIFSQEEEEKMNPDSLYRALMVKLTNARILDVAVNQQYRMDFQASLGNVLGGFNSKELLKIEESDEENNTTEHQNGYSNGIHKENGNHYDSLDLGNN